MANTGDRFTVCIPRKYRDSAGNEKTHFWQVGTGFGFESQSSDGASGVSVKLYSKMLLTDQLVLFKQEPEAPSSAPPPDDMPF